METFGAQLVLVENGEVHIAVPFSRHIAQQHGFLHGGAVAGLVDTACGYAALTQAPPECEVVTAEFKINMLRPAVGERFLAVGKVHNAGRTLAVCTGEIRAYVGEGDAYKVAALMQATMAFVQHKAVQVERGAC